MEIDDMFYGILDNIVYCHKYHSENIDEVKSQIIEKKCYSEDCSTYWKEKKKDYISETNECFISCKK